MSMKFIKEQPIIELSNIVVQFASRDGTLFNPKKFTAVNDVSLAIHAGETVGLVGQSGCGKSTLASVMIGLQKPTSGTVKFNGLEMKYGSAEARKYFGSQVSVIFQDPATALNPRMRVLDILKIRWIFIISYNRKNVRSGFMICSLESVYLVQRRWSSQPDYLVGKSNV